MKECMSTEYNQGYEAGLTVTAAMSWLTTSMRYVDTRMIQGQTHTNATNYLGGDARRQELRNTSIDSIAVPRMPLGCKSKICKAGNSLCWVSYNHDGIVGANLASSADEGLNLDCCCRRDLKG